MNDYSDESVIVNVYSHSAVTVKLSLQLFSNGEISVVNRWLFTRYHS